MTDTALESASCRTSLDVLAAIVCFQFVVLGDTLATLTAVNIVVNLSSGLWVCFLPKPVKLSRDGQGAGCSKQKKTER